MQRQQKKPALPRYVTRARCADDAYACWFQVYPRGARTRLCGELGTSEFRAAYSVALVNAIAAEKDERIFKRSRGR